MTLNLRDEMADPHLGFIRAQYSAHDISLNAYAAYWSPGSERDPSELPVAITVRWFKRYTRRPFDDHDEYVNVCQWADGTTSEYHTIPTAWNAIATATHLRKLDASNARMAAEHKAGTVGSTPVELERRVS